MKMFQEDNGNTSSVRIGMLIALLIAGYIAIAGVYLDRSLLELTGLCTVFVGGGFGAKVAQKGKEQ